MFSVIVSMSIYGRLVKQLVHLGCNISDAQWFILEDVFPIPDMWIYIMCFGIFNLEKSVLL